MAEARSPAWRWLVFARVLVVIAIVAAVWRWMANSATMEAFEAIERFGKITLCDGSSYYTFTKKGTFTSGPLTMSGRTLRGRWSKDPNGRLVAIAREGWDNGWSTGDDYRRIAFHVGYVTKRPRPLPLSYGPVLFVFDGYFIIDEMIATPKPAKPMPSDADE